MTPTRTTFARLVRHSSLECTAGKPGSKIRKSVRSLARSRLSRRQRIDTEALTNSRTGSERHATSPRQKKIGGQDFGLARFFLDKPLRCAGQYGTHVAAMPAARISDVTSKRTMNLTVADVAIVGGLPICDRNEDQARQKRISSGASPTAAVRSRLHPPL